MAFVYNPFTNEFDYYLEDLSGAEIVALLEALAGDARLSHDSLSDVSTSDHHAKYTDAEARAAAFATAAVLGTL